MNTFYCRVEDDGFIRELYPNMRSLFYKNFLLKIHGCGYHTLCGWPLLVKLVGFSMAKRLVLEAYNSKQYKCTFCLRRGLKLDFYSK